MARKTLYPPSIDPGLPVAPPVPAGWTCVTFGDVVEPFYRRINLEPDREYALLIAKRSRGGIELRGRVTGEEILTKVQFEAHAGDFLISRRQIIHGACGVVPEDLNNSIVSGEYSTLRTRPGLLMDFLRHYSHTSYFQRTCFHSSHGVDVEKMVFKLDRWLQWPFVLPPLGEQRKIAAILSSVDEAIEKTQAVIDQVQVVKKGLMQELLTKGLPGRHKKFKSFSMKEWQVGRVAQTEIKEIPETWNIVQLVSIARLESGHTPSRQHPEYWSGDVPWISLHDSKGLDGPMITQTAQTIGPLGLANSSARLLPPGTVIFSRTATVGKAAIMGREMSTSQDFANFVCGNKLHNRYLMHLFRSMQSEWQRLMAGSTHQTIYMPTFKKLHILLPPFEEQQKIAEIAEGLDARVRAEVVSREHLRNLKKGLMQTLLTGEVRVEPLP